MAETVLINAGDVIEVQLTSETVVIESEGGRRNVEPGHITNRMRLFVRHTDGSEKKYDFEDTELGVRETQRVAIVRGQLKRWPEPINLILFNLSSGESDTFDGNLAAYLGHKPFIGPILKAALLALAVALIYWIAASLSAREGADAMTRLGFAVLYAVLSYPVFWWLCRTWDRLTQNSRYRAARRRFINEMSGRVQAYAPTRAAAEPAAPAAAPSAAPEPGAG